MPSFDVVSEVDKHELTNAVDTANRELGNRFDFKGQDAKFELDGFVVTQRAPSDFQLKQMLEILRARLVSRGIDLRCLDVGEPEVNLAQARQKVTIKQGIEQKLAKKIVDPAQHETLKGELHVRRVKLAEEVAQRPKPVVAARTARSAEVKVLETVISEIEEGLRRQGIELPPPPEERV